MHRRICLVDGANSGAIGWDYFFHAPKKEDRPDQAAGAIFLHPSLGGMIPSLYFSASTRFEGIGESLSNRYATNRYRYNQMKL
jgi:hypothetical protein